MTRTFFLQFLIAVGLLLGIEATLRVGYTLRLDAAKEPAWFRYDADLGWDRRPNYSGEDDCSITRTFDVDGLVASETEKLSRKDTTKRLRIAFLGDSSTYGACAETDDTFVSVAGRLVPEVDVVNLGMNGYSSYQGYKALLKYGQRVRPDLIFVSFNINDRRFVLDTDLADSDAFYQRIARADLFQRLADRSYFVWAAAEAGKWLSGQSAGVSESIGDTESAKVRLDKVVPRVSPKDYRDNLNKMVQWAKENGSAVVFILLGDNPDQSNSLREGLKRLSDKDVPGAVKALEEARDEPDDIWFAPVARLYLSKLYSETGRPEEAREVLTMQNAITSLVGGYPIFPDSHYHGIMRDVASQHGISIVDAAAELDKHPEIFWDYCHFDEKGHEIVGQLVAAAIKARLPNGS